MPSGSSPEVAFGSTGPSEAFTANSRICRRAGGTYHGIRSNHMFRSSFASRPGRKVLIASALALLTAAPPGGAQAGPGDPVVTGGRLGA